MSVCPSQVGDSVLQLNFSQAILARILVIVHPVFFVLYAEKISGEFHDESEIKRETTKKVEYWSWNHFYGQFLPSADSSRAVVSYWWHDVH